MLYGYIMHTLSRPRTVFYAPNGSAVCNIIIILYIYVYTIYIYIYVRYYNSSFYRCTLERRRADSVPTKCYTIKSPAAVLKSAAESFVRSAVHGIFWFSAARPRLKLVIIILLSIGLYEKHQKYYLTSLTTISDVPIHENAVSVETARVVYIHSFPLES